MKGMRFIVMTLFLPFSITMSFAQKEANIWYFGDHAGLDFNSGFPIALTDNNLTNNEYYGAASIADSNGNLLFYTNGETILNKNHSIMLNGTLAAKPNFIGPDHVLIVPKPGSSSIYYLFYTGVGWCNPTDCFIPGLYYSEIDMSLDNGLGGVTALKKDVLLLDKDISRGLSATVHDNGQDIWIVTHKWNAPRFYAILVTDLGVSTAPIISNVGMTSYAVDLKLAPNGKKLVLRDNDIYLFDFDNTTGIVNSPILIDDTGYFFLGSVEFSPSGDVLYVSSENWGGWGVGHLYQYNLNATDIKNSGIELGSPDISYSDIQVAPDQKIYVSILHSEYIGVINSPETIGPGCGLVLDAVYLNGGRCDSKLPDFIQSYFHVGIQTVNVCLGEATQFHFNSSKAYDSLLWDFGDGTTSTAEEPLHTYASAGDFTVTLNVTSGIETSTDTKTVTIYQTPVAHKPGDIIICDPETEEDGYYDFNLDVNSSDILNGQDPANFEVAYYASMEDYNINQPISNPGNYTNSNPYVLQTIIASVKNRNNPQCDAITSFNIQVIRLPNSNQSVSTMSLCDDSSVGTDSDGVVQIDLTQKEIEILNGQLSPDFKVTYFRDVTQLNEILDPTQYQNSNQTETIYVLVTNITNTVCSGDTSFDIEVHSLPMATPIVELKQCDDDLDGFSPFNLNEVKAEISSNFENESITFYITQADAETGSGPITDATTYVNQTVSTDTMWARVENGNGCFRTSQINLIVTTTQIPSTFIRGFRACEDLDGDSTNGISIFDFSSVDSEIQALFPSGQDLVITYYRNETDALTEENKIDDISNYSNTGYPNMQQIYVRVDSKIDNDCLGLGAHINLYVAPLPEFTIESQQIVCSSDPTFTVVLDPIEENPQEIFSYSWVLNGVEIATSSTLAVSTPGTYSITLTKTDGTGCSRTREIFVNASELATITTTDVTIVELSNNNSITINNGNNNLGNGHYEFALDNSSGSYQDAPYFDHLSAGKHTLYVRDKKGCGIAQLDIFIMGFPKFFTPNDDGFHDTWNIEGLSNDYTRNSRVYIFDRYGKLLIQLDPKGANWNGTFNGEKLRPSDYWFVAELHNVDGSLITYRGHFSLVR